MTDAELIARARALIATQPPFTVAVYERQAWLADSDGEICVGSYPNGTPREHQARAIMLAVNTYAALLDALPAILAWAETYRVSEPDEEPDYDFGLCGASINLHQSAIDALTAIREALEGKP